MAVIKNKHTTNNKWFIDIRYQGKRYRKKSPENSRNGALAFERLIMQKLVKGENPFVKKVQKEVEVFEKFAWKWHEVYVKNNCKISGVRGRASILNKHLIPFFGKKKLDLITSLNIEEFKALNKNKGLANKTINEHITVLNTILKFAVEWSELEKKPKIKLLKVPPQDYDFLSFEESDLLLSSTDGMLKDMILLVLRTGLRYGEIRALSWSDINFETNVISVRKSFYRNILGVPKNSKERHIPFDYEVREIFERRKKSKGFVFTDKNGNFLEENLARRALKKAISNLDLKNKEDRKIMWHALRHSFASHLAMKGCPIVVIQKLMGHSSVSTTMRYAHLSPSTLEDSIKLLSKKGQYMDSEQINKAQFVDIMKSLGVQFNANNKPKTEPFGSASDCGDGES